MFHLVSVSSANFVATRENVSSGEDGKNSDKQCGSVTYFSGINTFLPKSSSVQVVSVEVFRRHQQVVEKIQKVTLYGYIRTNFTAI